MAKAVLSERMKRWIGGLGGHIATASKEGIPEVIVVNNAKTEGDSVIKLYLSDKQAALIKNNVETNPRVALGPAGIGSIRAAYQFKGEGRLEGTELAVTVDEIYCTKPGPEAGLRLDVLPLEAVVQFEKSRWKDDGPPRL
jgi:predicted pyridoxine 5'-phosphate oxidase superfamily flavin-nucleotide-binding protein